MAAGDGLDLVHRRADDLEPANLQLVEHPHPSILAVVRARGPSSVRRLVDRRALAHALGAGSPLFDDDSGRSCKLRAGQAAARHSTLAPIGATPFVRARSRAGACPRNDGCFGSPLRAATTFVPFSSRTAAARTTRSHKVAMKGRVPRTAVITFYLL